jgi:ATP-binding cassette subfamily F protein 3
MLPVCVMIEFRDVSIHFGTQEVLRNVRLLISRGERVGIVGPNGAGKSTLFGLINGDLSPYRGDVTVPKDCRLGYVRQQLPEATEGLSLVDFALEGLGELKALSGRIREIESLLAGAGLADEEKERLLRELGELQSGYEHRGGYRARSSAEALLCGLGFDPDGLTRPLTTFSGGWRMRAELARALVAEPDALLLDEPSNYLDIPAVEWLQRFLREFPGTLLLISHDRYLLESLTTTTVEVRSGSVTRYTGDFRYYLQEREKRYRVQESARRNQDRQIEQAERFIERFRAKNTKATQVQSRIKALEKIERIDLPPDAVDRPMIRIAPPPHCGHELLRLDDAAVTYDRQHWVLRHVNIRVEHGDRIALVGYNGMGKTTLLRLMAGQRAPGEGRRVLGHKVMIGYQSQDFAETMPPSQTVMEVVQARAAGQQVGSIRSLLGSFGFTGDEILKPCGVLSGGEKIRLAFARLFVNPPNLLLLDEPTTHLDMAGREALEEALRSYKGTICFVSHDVTFVRNIATSIIEITREGVRRFVGGYDYYREKMGEGREAPGRKPATTESADRPASRKDLRRERAQARQERARRTRQLERRLATVEQTVETLEAERSELATRLGGEGIKPDFEALNRRLLTIEEELVRYEDEWERVTDELAAAAAESDS